MKETNQTRTSLTTAIVVAIALTLTTVTPGHGQHSSEAEASTDTHQGVIVSLPDYLKRGDSAASRQNGKEQRDASDTATDRLDPKGSAADAASESPPLGLLLVEAPGTSGDGESESTPERPKLCVLLFKPHKAYLKVKACELCELLDAEGEKSTEKTAESPSAKAVSPPTVTITGKRVTRGGITAIFVDDIRS